MVKVAQNNTVWRSKLEEMIIWKKSKKLSIARVLKLSDLVRIFQHKTSQELRVTGAVRGPRR